MKNILIIGATSAIAQSCAREWLKVFPGSNFCLTGRNHERLDIIKSDLEIRGAVSVHKIIFDINDAQARSKVVAQAVTYLGQLDIVLVAPGSLPDQQRCQKDDDYAYSALNENGISVLLVLEQIAKQLEHQRSGKLAVISSVAGDRGRMSNYYYGAAKAAVTAFSSGLMMRLQKSGVSVSIIKPGFVRTPMTAGLDLPEGLVAAPEDVAEVIVKAVNRGRGVIYAPRIWLLIMTIIRLMPAFIFRRLNL